jgi:hypothetical protein
METQDQANNSLQALELAQQDGRVRSGEARMRKLSPAERSTLGKRAAAQRWVVEVPEGEPIYKAKYPGILTVELADGPLKIQCAVLDDGITRVISRNAVFRAFRRTKRGRAKDETRVPNMPSFADAWNIQPFISKYVEGGLKQLYYSEENSDRIYGGYNALVLPQLCNAYLDARRSGALTKHQAKIAIAAEILMGALGAVGIIALIDEATGFQYIRDSAALQEILNMYIGKELARWAKRFPDEFYKEIFRLQGWKYDPNSTKRPMRMAQITVDLVFDRIGPGLTKELKERRQEIFDDTGKWGKLHQVMTPNVGHPALQHHLSGLTFLAKAFKDREYSPFYQKVEEITPRYNRTLALPLTAPEPEVKESCAIGQQQPSGQSPSV